MRYSVIRASVQTVGVIDGAVTGLLLVAVLLIAVLVPAFCPQNLSSTSLSGNGTSRATISFATGGSMGPIMHPVNPVVPAPAPPTINHTNWATYNSSDVYWWYYTQFQKYQEKLRRLGNMLDATFIFVLLVIVVSDVVLIKAAEGTVSYKHALGSVYYWIVCNMFVIMVLPVVSIFSIQIAGATGALKVCGMGCGLPYFYITYRLLYGLMVVLYLCELWKGNYVCYKPYCCEEKLAEVY